MGNPLRGEVDIVVAGKTYTLRPSFTALAAIEEKLNMGIYEIGARATFSIKHIMRIFTECAYAGGTPLEEDFADKLLEEGVANYIPQLKKLIEYSLSGAVKGDPKLGEKAPPVT